MIYSIQLLRFIASSFVVLSHCLQEFLLTSVGAFGVDIFFVLSGFIIMYVTQEDGHHFMTKRIARIVPLYWAFTLAIYVIWMHKPDLLNNDLNLSKLITSLAFLPPLDGSTDRPVLPLGWTLNFEMYFYVCFWLAMKISHRLRDLWATIIMAAILVIGKFGLLPKFMNFYADPIIFEFTMGMFAMRLATGGFVSFTRPLSIQLVVLILTGTLVVTILVDLFMKVGDLRFVIFGPLAFLLLLATLRLETSVRHRRWALSLGDTSYCLYLIHMYIIAGLARILGFNGWGSLPLFFVVVLLSSTVVSWLVHKIFEAPMRRYLSTAEQKSATGWSRPPAP